MATSAEAAGRAAQTPRRVFISYSRKDGSSTALHLRDTLTAAGCEVWLDTDRIPGGASWSKLIEDALNNCDALVAVLTEGSFISETCRAEQMWAIRGAKRVIPVLASPNAPRPLYLSTLNYREFPDRERDLLADLDTQPLPTPSVVVAPLRYDTIPSLPQNFILRQQAVADLRNLVFNEGEQTNIAVTAVAGMGGIGKTVLVTALCRDTAVQGAFPDGIAWITIGREWSGDFVPRMREVAKALGDDLAAYDTPLACQNRYRNILREKAALIVVDDVWNIEHLKLLLVDAPRSRFLFTTRDGGIAKNITDRKYSAKLLDEGEARMLLARSAHRKLEELPPEADQIARECNGLAAAISQIGASLRDLSLPEWRDTLEALENADISAIEEGLPPGQQSFFKSLAVSVQAIPPQMQDRYLKLAVLLKEVHAFSIVLQTLWAASEAETRRTARYLVDRSLATWDSSDDPSRGIKLHDLQLDYIRARYPNRESLSLIHGALRLSAHVTQSDPQQFASQVTGRLLPHGGSPGIRAFLDEIAKGTPRPWLRPLHPALHPPASGLVCTLIHSGSVIAVALSANGKLAISGSMDGTLKVWDVESGYALRTLEGHCGCITGVAVTRDWKRAVSASSDRTLMVWDLESAHAIRTLEGHSDWVHSAAITSDGKRVVSASADRTLKVWDLESGRTVSTLKGHSGSVNGVALTPDGKRAVSASDDGTLKIWDLESGHPLRTLEAHSARVNGVAVTGDGRRATSASSDNVLKVWDLESGRVLNTLRGNPLSAAASVAVTADGDLAVSSSSDSTLTVWDLESGHLLRTLNGHSDSVWGVAMTADGKRVISASSDRTVKVWNLESGSALHPSEGYPRRVNSVWLTADGTRAVTRSGFDGVKVWDVESGRVLRTLDVPSSSVCSITITEDGKFALCPGVDAIAIWDFESGRVARMLRHLGNVWLLAITTDGKRAVSVSSDSSFLGLLLKLWDLESGREIRTWKSRDYLVKALMVTPDGKRAIGISHHNTLRIWDLETGCTLLTREGHFSEVLAATFARDGQLALVAYSDRTLRLQDLQTGDALRTLEGHSGPIKSVAIRPDGKRAASASRDRTLKLWNLESGVCIATIHCDAEVLWCAFAQQTVIASDNVGRVHFFRLEEWLPPSMPVRLVILPFRTRLHPRCHFSKIFFL